MPEPSRSYGSANNLFVSRKANSDSILIGGVAEDGSRFVRVFTYRAAQMLWFFMTRLLFPEKSDMVTALVKTAELGELSLPTVTRHAKLDRREDGMYEVTGWMEVETWTMRLNEYEAHRLWTALDIALYPVGWQGSSSQR